MKNKNSVLYLEAFACSNDEVAGVPLNQRIMLQKLSASVAKHPEPLFRSQGEAACKALECLSSAA